MKLLMFIMVLFKALVCGVIVSYYTAFGCAGVRVLVFLYINYLAALFALATCPHYDSLSDKVTQVFVS